MKWAVSIGRFDIHTAVMILPGYRTAPRQGHLTRVRCVYGFLCKFRHFKLTFGVDEPDYLSVPGIKDCDWEDSVYGQHEEDVPLNAPPPLGKHIIITHNFDASLMHDVLSGKAVIGTVQFYNKTPIDWYCKKQEISETATSGAEFLSGRTCFE